MNDRVMTSEPSLLFRALLAEENLDGEAKGDEALRLPAGNSKQVDSVDIDVRMQC